VSARTSFLDRIPKAVLGAGFALASAFGVVACAVFYAATCAAILFVLYAFAVVFDKYLGSPLAPIIWPAVFFGIGLFTGVFVYAPITFFLTWFARRRMLVWLIAPPVVAIAALLAGAWLATLVETPDPTERFWVRFTATVVLPYFFAGGYFVFWLTVFVPTQLGPWLLRKLERG
jgi:hypothetical protein